MNTKILETDILIEPAVRFEMKKQELQSRRAFVRDVMVCLALIAFFAGMFFAIKQGLEMGLHLIAHKMKERVSVNRGF